MLTLMLLVTIAAMPIDPLDQRDAKTRMEHRLKGAFLAMQIRPGMSQAQVQAILGEPDYRDLSIGGGGCSYRNLGVRVSWHYPHTIWAPAAQLGPERMLLISAVPTWWVRLLVVPLLSAEYMSPPTLAQVHWCGIPICRRQP